MQITKEIAESDAKKLNHIATEELSKPEFKKLCKTLYDAGYNVCDILYKNECVVHYFKHLYFSKRDMGGNPNIIHGTREPGHENIIINTDTFMSKLLNAVCVNAYDIYGKLLN